MNKMNCDKIVCIIIVSIVFLSCSVQETKNTTSLSLSFQKSNVANSSLSYSFIYPILKIENLGADSIFVYFESKSLVLVDTINSLIELKYSIEKFPDNITYYEFAYPTFIGIGPNSKFRYYHEIEFYRYFDKLRSGTWKVFATIGFLEHTKDFWGLQSHDLRSRIVNNQSLAKSNYSYIEVVKK